MSITLTAPETYTATIDGERWHGITPVSIFWARVQAMISSGADVLDMTSPPEADPVIPAEVTKLQIRDQAASMDNEFPGLWAGMRSFIEADADRAERWTLAIGIPTSDPIIDEIQTELGWTLDQRNAFLIAAGQR